MIKKGWIYLGGMALMTVVFMPSADARLINGKIVAVDASANTMTLDHLDPVTGAEKQMIFKVQPDAKFSGVKSLADLKAGQQVWVDAKQDEASKSWEAVSVIITGVQPV